MSKRIILTAGILFSIGLCNLILAQGPPLPPGPGSVPIDGGISLLIAACAGFGAKKIYNNKADKKEEEEAKK
jgi:ABC-type antimicrobial peptide transport system permease subunit